MTAMVKAAHTGEMALVGAVLSRRFKLLDLLGQGGMGLVYEAEVLAPPGGRVAIKLLRAEHIHVHATGGEVFVECPSFF
jgi:hypothetical protein